MQLRNTERIVRATDILIAFSLGFCHPTIIPIIKYISIGENINGLPKKAKPNVTNKTGILIKTDNNIIPKYFIIANCISFK
jgi:uncharacterized protein (DUF2344 family)